MISRVIQVLVRVISLSLWLQLITLTETLIILDVTKISSTNCLENSGGGKNLISKSLKIKTK